ncbi:MAG: hypothetical protein M3464_06120 [Chloroflexota bacterium]|nr:hypothetical protein [Chloroflexota bacterium]
MDTTDFRSAWTDIWKQTPSRRNVLRLFGGTAIGVALFQIGTDEVAAACQKTSAKCDKQRRCCKGTTCKRGGQSGNGVCRDVTTDRDSRGKPGLSQN